MEKNALELCDFFSNYGSNFIPSLAFLEKKFEQLGYKTFFIFSNRNPSPQFFEWEKEFEKGRNVEIFDFSNFSIVNKTVDFIIRNNISIVHAHFIASFYLSAIKKRCPKEIKFFEHIHSAPYSGNKTLKARFKHLRNIFLLNHKIPKICVSEAIVPMTKYIYPFCKVVTCRNAVEIKRLIKRERCDCEEFRILLFGYNFYVKGVDLALDAIGEIAKRIPIHLDVVFSDHFKKNEDLILSKYGKIPDYLTLLHPVSDVSKLYCRYQVFLNASRSEGMSYANIEAYYSGCLCVFSDIPQTLEVNLPNVIYFKSGSSESLVSAIEKSFEIKSSYKNNCNFVEEHLSLNSWAERLISIFGLSN